MADRSRNIVENGMGGVWFQWERNIYEFARYEFAHGSSSNSTAAPRIGWAPVEIVGSSVYTAVTAVVATAGESTVGVYGVER